MKSELNYEQLSNSSIFMGISPEQIKKILPCITYKIKKYSAEQKLFEKGTSVNNLGIVLEGLVAICRENTDGKRNVIATIGPNDLFGEAIIFSSGSTIPNDIVALKETKVLYLASDFFLRPCGADCPNKDSHGEVMKNMLRVLSDRAQLLNKKISYLTAADLKTKLAMYLYDLHLAVGTLEFNLPLNRDRLAEYLSVARPSLSREFINLKNMGIIDFYRSNLSILDLQALYEIANSQ